jgi:hypothetical protein
MAVAVVDNDNDDDDDDDDDAMMQQGYGVAKYNCLLKTILTHDSYLGNWVFVYRSNRAIEPMGPKVLTD